MLTLHYLRAQLEAAHKMHEMASERARAAFAVLHNLARRLAPAAYDALMRDGAAPMTPEEFGDWLARAIEARLSELSIAARAASLDPNEIKRLRAAERDAAELRQFAEQLQGELRQALLEREALRQRVAQLEAELSRVRSAAAVAAATAGAGAAGDELSEPSADAEGVADADECPATVSVPPSDLQLSSEAKALLRVMGEHGFAVRRPAAQILLASGEWARESVSYWRELEQAGLLRQIKPSPDASTPNPPVLVGLTAAGKAAYEAIFGGRCAEQQLDALLSRHKHPDHIVLILRAAEYLSRWYPSVNIMPAPARVNGRQIAPDIVCVPEGGQAIYVECERTPKPGEAMMAKLDNLFLISASDLYFAIPPVKSLQSALVSAVTQWAFHRRVRARLRVALVGAQAGDSPWVLEREIGMSSCALPSDRQ